MNRLGIVLRVAALGMVFALPVFADAPVGGADQQYANFDSNTPYITDRFTHLVWERPTSEYPQKMDLDGAKAHCTTVGSSFRLPSAKELLTIVDEQPHGEYEVNQLVDKYIDRSAFPRTPAEEFWTSSIVEASPVLRAATVDFGSGVLRYASSTDLRRVRCVQYKP
jgi:hypothetical protein